MDFTAQISKIVLFLFALHWGVSNSKNIELFLSNPMKGSNKSYVDFTTLRLTKVRETRQFKLSGTFTVEKDMSEEELSYALYLKSPRSKQFSATPMLFKAGPVCQLLKEDKNYYEDLANYSNLPPPGTCPFPKGSYTVNNYLLSEDNIPNVPPGEYKAVVTLKYLGKFLSGYEAIVKIS